METQKELLTLPLYYDEGGQMILDQRGIVLDVRMWGRITGTGGMNLPSSEAMKIQDDFGKRVVEILNKEFATEDKKAPQIGDGYQPTNTVDTSNPPRQKVPVEQEYKSAIEILANICEETVSRIDDSEPVWIHQGHILKAMQEYTSQERNRAISECISRVKNQLLSRSDTNNLVAELEKLKK